MDTPPDAVPVAARWAAVVLAGGTAVRLDGADKASVEYGGRPLLAHALDALTGAAEVVVVGDPAPTGRPVTFTRERPSYGGPVAGLLSGRDALLVPPVLLGVLAVDMPRVTAATFRRLLAAARGREGAFLVGADGRRQLAAVLDLGALDRVRPPRGDEHGMALHRLVADLDLADVPAEGSEARDVDTWADLRDP